MVQISGRYLIVTGKNSAKHIDKSWNVERAKDVTTIRFSCVSFNSLVPVFNRVKVRFPNAENLVFSECDFNYIGQLNSLADVQGVTSVEIQPKRNDIVTKNWRSYAIFRLHHWGLQIINNVQVGVICCTLTCRHVFRNWTDGDEYEIKNDSLSFYLFLNQVHLTRKRGRNWR